MIIDMHMHEKTYSLDSFLKLEDIVNRAKELGLDGICITDHESNSIKEYAEIYSKDVDFPIFVGFEYLTDSGDILVFGVDKVPDEVMLPLDEFLDYVESEGGIAIAAHPYRKNFRGLEEKIRTAKIHGIETFNGSTPEDLNQKALKDAIDRNIHKTGASDCHVMEKIGVFATHVPDGIKNVNDLVGAFKNPNSDIYPMRYNGKDYVKAEQNLTFDLDYQNIAK